MTGFIELLKAVLYGVLEGITEWLPISSTGHLILLEEFLPLRTSEEFFEMFEVVIQLGASLAVVSLFAKKLIPRFFFLKNTENGLGWGKAFFSDIENRRIFSLWGKIIVALLPSAIIGLLFDDWFDLHFYNATTVVTTLALYGILYIIIENIKKNQTPKILSSGEMTYKQAFLVGCFQVLALIPGTSRSGSTILGGLMIGFSRSLAAEISFFLALPTMLGASALKALKFVLGGTDVSSIEVWVLIVGCIVAYLVSVVAIKFLMNFVKQHTFIPFGVYRILLALLVAMLLFRTN